MDSRAATPRHPETSTPRHTDTPPVTVYRPNMRHELGFFETWAIMADNVWGARELIWQLFKRDFFAQYKKSFIGYTWAFIGPVLGIVHWVFLQMTGILKPGELDIPYPVYVLMGTSMWGLFSGFLGAGRSTLGAGSKLLMQVKYPHEALLFKQCASFLADYLIRFVMILVVLFAFRVFPSWKLLLFPLVALPLFFLGTAMGLIISLIGIVAMDVNRVIGIGLAMLMWTTPLIYSNKVPSPFVQTIIKWNPLTYLVCSCRDMIIYGRFYENNANAYYLCAGVTFVLFLLAWRLFFVSEDKIIERMI